MLALTTSSAKQESTGFHSGQGYIDETAHTNEHDPEYQVFPVIMQFNEGIETSLRRRPGMIFITCAKVNPQKVPEKEISPSKTIDDIQAVQELITNTLGINQSLLANILNVERKTLYNHRKAPPRDATVYMELSELADQIRGLLPFGLEAGSKVIFKDGECLKDHIKNNPGNLQSVKEFALYVAGKWHRKHG